MKPESVKSILRSFLKEKQYSSCCDDVDGLSFDNSEYISGETFDSLEGRASGLLYMEPQAANIPLHELNAPLDPELEIIAAGIGRQLSEISDKFESDHEEAISDETSANEIKSVQFREHIVRVPLNSEHVQISVIRAGGADGVLELSWRTCDKSAKAGLNYVNSQGNISFAEGEEEKTIEVEIIQDQELKNDICFAVELLDDRGTFNTLMVYIVDDSKLYLEEKRIIENIFDARHISVSEVVTRLSDNVTHNTFKAALQYLCSSADSIPTELALASELLWLTLPHARLCTLTNVLCDFCSDLPDLEDIASMF